MSKRRKAVNTARANPHSNLSASVVAYEEDFLYEMLDASDRDPFLLVLDGVLDPHNLGACMRSADAAGVQAVIIPRNRAVSLTDTVRKIACGAAEHLPLIRVTNLVRTLKELQNRNVWLVGTVVGAEKSIYETDLTGPIALVMGGEEKGLRRLTRECCDFEVSLPMAGAVESLNVSVATGVCLFEAVRQRRDRSES